MIRPNLHLQSDWVQNNQILKYAIYSVNRGMMQEWSENVLTSLRHWDKETPPKIIFDLTYPNVSMSYFVLSRRELFNMGITTSGKQQFLTYLKNHPQVNIQLAVILSSTMLGTLNNYVPIHYDYDNFTAKIFFNATAAQQWLMVLPGEEAFNTGTITSETLYKTIETLEVDQNDVYGNRDHLRILVNGTLEIIPITDARPIIVGRTSRADLDLSMFGQVARNVSRQHAQISLTNGRLTIIDLDSRNGTYIGKRKLEAGKPVFIRKDDVIRLGSLEMSIIF